jgi:hypothetical protein
MSVITKKNNYKIESKSIFDKDYDKNEVDDINKKFEYIGHINDVDKYFREFIIVKCLVTDEYYLNIFSESVKEKHLIKINIDDKNEIKKVVDRYNTNKRVAGFGEGIGLIQMHRQRAQIENDFSSPPETVDKDEYGWHRIIKGVGKFDSLDEIAQIENGLVFNKYTHSVFIKQMTAFYADENITIIETIHSDSLLVFNFSENQSSLFVTFYFQGESINDIPIDVQMCIDVYGIYETKET